MRNSHRYSNIFVVLPWKTEYFKNYIFPFVINEQNKVETNIRSSSSHNSFHKAFLKFKTPVERKLLNTNSLNTKLPSYRNQSTDMLFKSIDWFLHDVQPLKILFLWFYPFEELDLRVILL